MGHAGGTWQRRILPLAILLLAAGSHVRASDGDEYAEFNDGDAPDEVEVEAEAPDNSWQIGSEMLFAYFGETGMDGLHLAYSPDGYTFMPLNEGKAILKPGVGQQKLMIDPSISWSPDGTFHLVWNTGVSGETAGYANSRDLLNWGTQMSLHVPAEHGDRWSPDVFHDSRSGRLMVMWSSSKPGRTGGHPVAPRLLYTSTLDFRTFEPVRVVFEPGYAVMEGHIAEIFACSPTQVKCGEGDRRYILWHREVGERLTVNGAVKEASMRFSVAAGPLGPFSEASTPITPEGADPQAPSFLRVNNTFMLYYHLPNNLRRYGAMMTSSFSEWEDVSDRLNFPQGARHGQVFRAPPHVLKGLFERFGKPTVAPARSEREVLHMIREGKVAAGGGELKPGMGTMFPRRMGMFPNIQSAEVEL